MNSGFLSAGIEVHDLEYDVKAFNIKLRRIRVVSLDDFYPEDFLR
jgi:putative heme uptake system protein